MKARPLTLCLLTATFCVASAFAQTGTKPAATKADGSGQMEKRRQEMLKRFDLNGDGRLDETEKAALKEAQKKPGGLRGSGDIGSLGGARESGPEGAGRGDRPIREMIKRFDRDGDGKLDETELAEAEKARANYASNRAPGAPGARLREQMLKLFDKNGDGQLDPEERAAADQFRADQAKRFDRNGDGQLDQEERAEAMRAFAADHPELAPPPGR
jgi:Ca2+-binding EF-hand superfamily protein